jgi:TRAP-type C4-dicarboxylate transport system permease small subunit
MLKILAALVALVLLMVGLAAAAHAYDLLRHVYGPTYQLADLAFVIGAAALCFGGAHLCIRFVFGHLPSSRGADTRRDTTEAE